MSMRSTPISTARRSTRMHSSRSDGSPQTPFPVICMAPKPRRWTVTAPGPPEPNVMVPLERTGFGVRPVELEAAVPAVVTGLAGSVICSRYPPARRPRTVP